MKLHNKRHTLIRPIRQRNLNNNKTFIHRNSRVTFSVTQQRRNRQRRIILSTITFSVIRLRILRNVSRNNITVNRTVPLIFTIVPIIPIMRRMVIRRNHTGRKFRISTMPRIHTINRPRDRTNSARKVFRHNSITILMMTTFSLRITVLSSLATILNSRTLGLHSNRRVSRNFSPPFKLIRYGPLL